MSECGRFINYTHEIRRAKVDCPRCSQEVWGKINDKLTTDNESNDPVKVLGILGYWAYHILLWGWGKGSNAFRTGAVVDCVPHFVTPQGWGLSSNEGNCAMSSSSYLLWAGRKIKLVMWYGVAGDRPSEMAERWLAVTMVCHGTYCG